MVILRLRKDKEFTSFLSYVLQLHLHVHKDDVVALHGDWRQETLSTAVRSSSPVHVMNNYQCSFRAAALQLEQ